MSRTFKFASRYGSEYEIRFTKTKYVCDGSLAIWVECYEPNYDWWEPYARLTVNIGLPTLPDEAYLDENNVPDLCEFVIGNGWARNVGSGKSGWCTYPKVEFTDAFLNEICEVQK